MNFLLTWGKMKYTESSLSYCCNSVWWIVHLKYLYFIVNDLHRIPLVQSKQKFYSMDFDLRNNLKGWVETSADKFG